jgi:hypothetical protein
LVPIEGFQSTKGERWFKSRTYLLSSDDKGRTWRYQSTIAYDGRTGQESFCEPALADLGGGEFLAVMRTGHFAPLYQTRSVDGGKTWLEPRSLRILGLSPQLALLPDGTLACSFGWRPTKNNSYYKAALEDYHKRYRGEVEIEDPSREAGDYVMFSLDKGQSWTRPRRIAAPLTLGFTRLAAIGQDSFLVISQRLVIPGESDAAVMRAWQENSAPGMPGFEEWSRRSRRILEARMIRLRP